MRYFIGVFYKLLLGLLYICCGSNGEKNNIYFVWLQVLDSRNQQIEDRMEEVRERQEESLRHREQLLREMEIANQLTRRDQEKAEAEKEELKLELLEQVGNLHQGLI